MGAILFFLHLSYALPTVIFCQIQAKRPNKRHTLSKRTSIQFGTSTTRTAIRLLKSLGTACLSWPCGTMTVAPATTFWEACGWAWAINRNRGTIPRDWRYRPGNWCWTDPISGMSIRSICGQVWTVRRTNSDADGLKYLTVILILGLSGRKMLVSYVL